MTWRPIHQSFIKLVSDLSVLYSMKYEAADFLSLYEAPLENRQSITDKKLRTSRMLSSGAS